MSDATAVRLVVVDGTIGADGRTFLTSGGSWSATPAVEGHIHVPGGPPPLRNAAGALLYAPAGRDLLSRAEWTVLACYRLLRR